MNASAAKLAPTGCYKCGRPGHWSRDCPDSNPNPNTASSNSNSNSNTNSYSRSTPVIPSSTATNSAKPATPKPKKVPRTRPKLTPDLLLGDDGLGYVLRHFPRNFKYRGRGHEVEQVAASKRAKLCINDLKVRIEGGGDLTKLCESPAEQLDPEVQLDPTTPAKAGIPEDLNHKADQSSKNHDADISRESMLNEICDQAVMAEPTCTSNNELQQQNNGAGCSNGTQITEEQKARIEANRRKALERAAARSQLLRSA